MKVTIGLFKAGMRAYDEADTFANITISADGYSSAGCGSMTQGNTTRTGLGVADLRLVLDACHAAYLVMRDIENLNFMPTWRISVEAVTDAGRPIVFYRFGKTRSRDNVENVNEPGRSRLASLLIAYITETGSVPVEIIADYVEQYVLK